MKDVLSRLRGVGFKQSFIRERVLPTWWDDSIAEDGTSFEEAIWYLSVRLGVEPASLRSGENAVFVESGDAKFKKAKNVAESELEAAKNIALRALRLACFASPISSSRLASASTIRAEILGAGHMWITLDLLLDWCWQSGIPVLHIKEFGGPKKMDGMAMRHGEKFAVALCRADKPPSRQLFNLAHELGHIMCGHLPENGSVVDEGGEKRMKDDRDSEEVQANAFASALLSGYDRIPTFTGRFNQGPTLADKARKWGSENRMSPGLAVLCYANANPVRWYVTQNALAILEADLDAPEIINNVASSKLEWDRLSDEDADYLRRITGIVEDHESSLIS